MNFELLLSLSALVLLLNASAPRIESMDDAERAQLELEVRKEYEAELAEESKCCPKEMSCCDGVLCVVCCLPCCQCWCNRRNKYSLCKCHRRYAKPCIRACGRSCLWKYTLCAPCNICGCLCPQGEDAECCDCDKPETDVACSAVCNCCSEFWRERQHLMRECCIVGGKGPQPPKQPHLRRQRIRERRREREAARREAARRITAPRNRTSKGLIAAGAVTGGAVTGVVVGHKATKQQSKEEEMEQLEEEQQYEEEEEPEDDEYDEDEDEDADEDECDDDEDEDEDEDEEEDDDDDDDDDEGCCACLCEGEE